EGGPIYCDQVGGRKLAITERAVEPHHILRVCDLGFNLGEGGQALSVRPDCDAGEHFSYGICALDIGLNKPSRLLFVLFDAVYGFLRKLILRLPETRVEPVSQVERVRQYVASRSVRLALVSQQRRYVVN